MRYQFIAEQQNEYAITTMGRVLEVSVSGYYIWSKRLPGHHSREDAQIAQEVQGAFQANRQVYGSPCMHAELHAHGRRCGRKWIAQLMRELHLRTQLSWHRTITTRSEQGARVADNLLQQDFHADSPNRKWVTDTPSTWLSCLTSFLV